MIPNEHARVSTMAAVIALLSSVMAPARAAADYPPFGWLYETPQGRFADVMASACGYMAGLATAGACGVILVVPGVAHEVANSDEPFGHYSAPACEKPFVVSAAIGYLVVGAPFFAGQLLFWDLPRWATGYGQRPEEPEEERAACQMHALRNARGTAPSPS
ncbi:MAG TPA: hypothetical protein VKH41_05010 [Myxococcota bacterium]|nr:hypothetical protein [Myxococcota bacterium]